MAFKVGDRVIITKPDDLDSGPSFVGQMEIWCGIPVEIDNIVGYNGEHDCDGGWYTIADGQFYYFAGDWMKKVVAFKGNV